MSTSIHYIIPLLIFLCGCCCFGTTDASRSDARILIETKRRQINDSVGALSDWIIADQNHVPCNWTGVVCRDGPRGPIVGIELANLGIGGEFPYNFCKIRSLKSLSLAWNSFNGTISAESVSMCSHLRSLNISQNLFYGDLPEFKPDFVELEVLDMSLCRFTGEIPVSFGRFPALKVLKLNSNLLSGSIPSFLTNLSQLTSLELDINSLREGPLPENIGDLTKLRNLWLSATNLIGEIPESIGKLASLENLDLSDNHLSGRIPTSIGGLKNAKQILLYDNHLSGELPESIGECTSLTVLAVSRNGLTGQLPAKVAGLPLEILQLHSNLFEGPIPESIIFNQKLLNLSLFNNSFSGELPAKLGMYADLLELDVSTNNFTGPLPIYLCFRKKLDVLIAFNNRFSGSLPDAYGECDSLSYVRIQNNQLSGTVPERFWSLGKMYHLELKNNRFDGTIPSSISSALQRLILSNNYFSGQLPEQICRLGNLRKFLAGGNRLNGQIPTCITELKMLQILELQDNAFSGELPGGLSSWVELTQLNVSNNQLSGKVPPMLGNLPVLTYLDLSKNHFSGEIPYEFGKSHFDQFNLSYNDFQGEVPPVFDSQLYLPSLVGIPGLCGTGKSVFPECGKHKTRTMHMYLIVVLAFVFALLVGCLLWFIFIRSKSKSNPFRLHEKLRWKVIAFQQDGLNENDIMSSLKGENVIGSGGSGQVFKVQLKSGQLVAVKQLWGRRNNPEMNSAFRSEVETLGMVRHRNIVKLLYACSSEEFMFLVYEYMENGSLGDVLHADKGTAAGLLDWRMRFKVALGAAKGLAYLHHDCIPTILHRDIKSNNILLDADFNPKLADFGIAKSLNCDVEEGRNEMSRVAEYAYTLKVTEKSDVYSYGVVLLELISGKRPNDPSFGEHKDIVKWARETITQSSVVKKGKKLDHIIDPRLALSPDKREEIHKLINLALQCTSTLPRNRPSMKNVVDVLKDQIRPI